MAMIDSIAGAAQPDQPDLFHEHAARADGACLVAGVDEAGRGPLAGPVVAAAVILDPDNIPLGLNDSKKLTEARREALFAAILETGQIGFCAAPSVEVDRLNIRGATLWAITQAVLSLPVQPDIALIDGRDVPPGLSCPGRYVIGGDAKSLSIAAASIVAKVVRDRMCAIMDCGYPDFGFARHKGYGTPVHMAALESLGPSEVHRMSFAPVMAAIR
ncbi:ribonuclease HII [Pelagibacterium limicola]|uniref:ribonuclease HII n=1 Tax=Pelagibacterium limicola TaxID=2791022 RepID=UPI001A9B0C72|nr:ribonuclease HII [Pelagibacterium limicola]